MGIFPVLPRAVLPPAAGRRPRLHPGQAPASRPTVYEWLGHLERNGAVGTVSRTRWTGRLHETGRKHLSSLLPANLIVLIHAEKLRAAASEAQNRVKTLR